MNRKMEQGKNPVLRSVLVCRTVPERSDTTVASAVSHAGEADLKGYRPETSSELHCFGDCRGFQGKASDSLTDSGVQNHLRCLFYVFKG